MMKTTSDRRSTISANISKMSASQHTHIQGFTVHACGILAAEDSLLTIITGQPDLSMINTESNQSANATNPILVGGRFHI